jgi:hypothetical protein
MWVDDFVMACESLDAILTFKGEIMAKYEMKDLGAVSKFLGMTVQRTREGMSVSQEVYCNSMLERYKMVECKAAYTPAEDKSTLSRLLIPGELDLDRKKGDMDDVSKYPTREAIGSLLYLAQMTRPDIANAVREICRLADKVCPSVVGAIKRVLRYVKGTKHYGLVFGRGRNWKLEIYADASYGECVATRRSTSGLCAMVGGAPVFWRSSTQTLVSQSSTEAEYITAADAVNLEKWLTRLYLWFFPSYGGDAVTIWEDNQAVIAMSVSEKVSRRSKHIDIRYHVTKEAVADNRVILRYIPTNEQVADLLTKNLGRTAFERLRDMLVVPTRVSDN